MKIEDYENMEFIKENFILEEDILGVTYFGKSKDGLISIATIGSTEYCYSANAKQIGKYGELTISNGEIVSFKCDALSALRAEYIFKDRMAPNHVKLFSEFLQEAKSGGMSVN